MGLLGKLATGGFIGMDLFKYQPRERGLVTFHGWSGKWWKKIRPAKAAYDAFQVVAPFKYGLAASAGAWAWSQAKRRWVRRRKR